MPSQERAHSKNTKRDVHSEEHEDLVAESVVVDKSDLDENVDAILDEIDDLLEVNAEDFVKSFVQKGGQ